SEPEWKNPAGLITAEVLPNERFRSAPWVIVSSTRAPTRALPWPAFLKEHDEWRWRNMARSAPPTTILDLLAASVAMAYPTGTISAPALSVFLMPANSPGVNATALFVLI